MLFRSINFLSGQTKYLHRMQGWSKLTDNPLTKSNAHSHRKNHPSGFDDIKEYINFLRKNTDFTTLYPIPLHIDSAAKKLGINLINVSSDDWKKVNQYIINDFNETLHWLSENNAKIIFMSLNESFPLYLANQRGIERSFLGNLDLSIENKRKEFESVFFQQSVKTWNDLNLTNTWDLRERLALDTRPFDFEKTKFDLSIPHFWLDSHELWFNGDKKIIEILKWLEIDIKHERFDHWIKVYSEWKLLQMKNIKFQFEYNHIVDAIINNWDFSIDLTFDQEVIIQHCLIYNHNLNLKTWQLEKFPNNTQDLHKLLEDNIHPIS